MFGRYVLDYFNENFIGPKLGLTFGVVGSCLSAYPIPRVSPKFLTSNVSPCKIFIRLDKDSQNCVYRSYINPLDL